MKIKYDMSDNYFKCYNESQGVILSKDEIIKNPAMKIYNYIEKGVITVILTLVLLFILFLSINIIGNNVFIKTTIVICFIILLLMIIYFLIFYISYSVEKRREHIGFLEIDSEGIKDFSSDGIIIGFNWDNIKAIVIKKNTINVLTTNSIYFFIDIKYKERFLLALERYNKNILIIDKTR